MLNFAAQSAATDIYTIEPGYFTATRFLGFRDAPANPDGDTTAGEFSADDYPPKFYTQILLAVDTSHSSEAYYPYAALRIEPDQLALIECGGATVTELDMAAHSIRPRDASGGLG